MLMGMNGGLNPMSFMGSGGNMTALAQSQQQSAGINGSSTPQAVLGGSNNGNGSSPSSVPPQQQ